VLQRNTTEIVFCLQTFLNAFFSARDQWTNNPQSPEPRGRHHCSREESMHPINSLLGEFSRAEQRVLQAIFKAIAEGGGRCVATLEMLARDSNTSKSTARNAIARAVAIGLLEKTERRYYGAVSLPNILSPGQLWQRVPPSDSMYPTDLSEREWPASDTIMNH
jgi:hypothetical protein